MGFSIGSIVSDITSVVSDPGKLVSQVADAILPSNMKAIGDAIGGIVDLNTGHPLQALSHLSDTLKDLPQLLGQSGAAAKAAATPAGTAAAEPSPPPARSLANVAKQAIGSAQPNLTLSVNLAGGQTLTLSENMPSVNSLSAKAAAPPSPSSTPIAPPAASGSPSSASAATLSSTASASAPPLASVAKQAIGSAHPNITLSVNLGGGQKLTISETVPSISANVPSGKTPAAAPVTTGSTGAASATSTIAATPASATPSTSTTAATDSTTKTGSASTATSTPGTSGPPASLASLMAMSPDQFMQAVTSGQIPPDVANNQSAMMQVQARMNSITQMNQLVTSMMSAMHQMQMSIIQNIRC